MHNRIVELRKALKLSQQEFADKIRISRSWLSNAELGAGAIHERHIALILAAFPQVSEEWLRHGTGPMFAADASPIRAIMEKYSFPDIVAQLLTAYSRLTDAEQQAVLRYTRDFVASLVGPAGTAAEDPEEPPEDDADIEAELEAYRAQLIAQKKGRSRSSGGSGTGTGPAAG